MTIDSTSTRFGSIMSKKTIFILVVLWVSVVQIMWGNSSTNVRKMRATSSSEYSSIPETIQENSIVDTDNEERSSTEAAPPVESTKDLGSSLTNTHFQAKSPTTMVQEKATDNSRFHVTIDENSVVASDNEEPFSTVAAPPVEPTKDLGSSMITTHHQPHSSTKMPQENATLKDKAVTSGEDEFRAENINNEARCGMNKCFFQLKDDPGKGYLVTHESNLSRHEQTYALAKKLTDKYGVENLSLEPPREVNLSEQFASYLNSNKTGNRFVENVTPTFLTTKPLFIQKGKVVPKPYIIIGCNGRKSRANLMDMKEKILPFVTKDQESSFVKNLEKGIMISKQVMKNETCLLKDWQAMMDLEGNLYQFDLDRCFREQLDADLGACSGNLDRLLRKAKSHFSINIPQIRSA